MTIYVIANQKGGVGKTTLSTNLAVALSKKGQTILVDGDDQQSSINGVNVEHKTRLQPFRSKII